MGHHVMRMYPLALRYISTCSADDFAVFDNILPFCDIFQGYFMPGRNISLASKRNTYITLIKTAQIKSVALAKRHSVKMRHSA